MQTVKEVKNLNSVKRHERWTEIIADFQRSRQSQLEYCRRNNLKDNQLRYWMRKTRKQKPEFIAVNLEQKVETRTVSVKLEKDKYRPLCTLEFGNSKRLIIEHPEALWILESIIERFN